MILVIGAIVARPETFDDIRRMALEHVHRSRKEPGCEHHSVQVDCENPMRLVFVERWSDAAALKAHFAVPGSAEFVRTAAALAAAKPEMAIYDAAEVTRSAVRT